MAAENQTVEGGRDEEELFMTKHPEWDALQWLEKFLPGGSQIACAKAEMERKGFTSTSLHYAVRSSDATACTLLRFSTDSTRPSA